MVYVPFLEWISGNKIVVSIHEDFNKLFEKLKFEKLMQFIEQYLGFQ